jgi:hypothetical protein
LLRFHDVVVFLGWCLDEQYKGEGEGPEDRVTYITFGKRGRECDLRHSIDKYGCDQLNDEQGMSNVE